jgi:hypothetical protein
MDIIRRPVFYLKQAFSRIHGVSVFRWILLRWAQQIELVSVSGPEYASRKDGGRNQSPKRCALEKYRMVIYLLRLTVYLLLLNPVTMFQTLKTECPSSNYEAHVAISADQSSQVCDATSICVVAVPPRSDVQIWFLIIICNRPFQLSLYVIFLVWISSRTGFCVHGASGQGAVRDP